MPADLTSAHEPSSNGTSTSPETSTSTYVGSTRERFLKAAARLFAERGYNEVGIMEIGAELGLTGAALYRHFDNKLALLTEMSERVIVKVTDEAFQLSQLGLPDEQLLALLIEGQIRMVVESRDVVISYNRHMGSLPPEDFRRLRRLQRLYIEKWIALLAALRPELDEQTRRALTHAAIAVLHSAVQFRSARPPEVLSDVLRDAAYRTLGLTKPAGPVAAVAASV